MYLFGVHLLLDYWKKFHSLIFHTNKQDLDLHHKCFYFRKSHQNTRRGTHGQGKWISCSPALQPQSAWGTFGDSRTYVTSEYLIDYSIIHCNPQFYGKSPGTCPFLIEHYLI